MWKSRRQSIDNSSIHRRSSSVNFTHTSFKDVEHLFSNDNESFGTPDQPPPSPATAAAVRRLSIFHRVHLANKFARAFSKPLPESRAAVEAKLAKNVSRAVDVTPRAAVEQKCASWTQNDSRAAEVVTRADIESKLMKNDSRADEMTPRAAVETKLTKPDRRIVIPGAEKRVVVYTTSLRVVRPTFEACRTVQSILRGFRVSIDERDLSMDSKFLEELQTIMNENNEVCEKTKMSLSLPKVFIGGRYIGGAEEVKMLHETGELKKYVEELPSVNCGVCELCGDFRFVLCDECRGSHKCYSEKNGFRSCTLCNENGLVRCLACFGR